VCVYQRAATQSPPPVQERTPSPSFELGLSSFPPLPGAAGNLKPEVKTENSLDNRLSDVVTGAIKDKVDFHSVLLMRVFCVCAAALNSFFNILKFK